MIGLLATTIISCKDVIGIVSRLSRSAGLSYHQRIEVIQVLQEHVPSCPVVIKENERPKRS
jgi:hypothetical protein